MRPAGPARDHRNIFWIISPPGWNNGFGKNKTKFLKVPALCNLPVLPESVFKLQYGFDNRTETKLSCCSHLLRKSRREADGFRLQDTYRYGDQNFFRNKSFFIRDNNDLIPVPLYFVYRVR